METTSRGFQIHYEVEGHGGAVVLLHGFGGSGVAWQEAGYVERLAPSFRVITLDALGHGASGKPHDPDVYRTPDRAADVVAVLDAEGIERAHLWGYSMGGRSAYATALYFPDRTASLVAGGSGPPELSDDSEHRRHEQLAAALGQGDWDAFWLLVGAPSTELRAVFEAANDPRALAAVLLGLGDWAIVQPSEITVPSLHYAGSRDPALGRVRHAARAMRGAFHEFGGLDHATGMSAVDRVAPVVIEHLVGFASA